MSHKKERKAEALLRSVAEKTGKSVEQVSDEAGALLEKEYGLYEGFERAVREGAEALTKIGIPEDLAKVFVEVGQERIHVPMVKVKGIVEVTCLKPNGVKIIKEAFSTAKKAEKSRRAKVRFYVIAAPKYAIEVMADNYKLAEDTMQTVADNIVSHVNKSGCQGAFRREK
jgi:translation initiation factor 2 subunit 1